MTEKEKQYIALGRHKARTDLLWLAKNVLGMKKIVPHVHGPMARFLQGFAEYQGEDTFNESLGYFQYQPLDFDPVKVITGSKRRLLLAPRGWYKTSLNVIAHCIQWILNFPDVTILLIHASQEIVEQILAAIKWNFWKNNVMRYYFPEFCAPQGIKEFGTQSAFNSPARRNWTVSPTISVGGIESIRTGMHYHVLKFTDIVDEKNTATKEQCEKIVYAYSMCRNLLISPLYWMDMEGTRYHFSDLYGRIIDNWLEEEKKGKPHEYNCFVMGCYKKKLGYEKFDPTELEEPYVVDSRFPEEFPTAALVAMQHDPVTGEDVFNTQQLNNPVGTENVAFPLQYMKWKSAEELKKIPIIYYKTTIDLAETAKKRSDFTAITTCGVDRMNRHYVVDIRLGKYLPDEIVDQIFIVQAKYRPVKIKIEETGFVRGLIPTIRRRSEMTGIWPNFEFIQRDNQTAKQERILSIQPWYKAGLIFFNEDLDDFVKEHLKHELTRFPKFQHDDILDTLADQFQNENVFGPVKEAPTMQELLLNARRIMLENLDKYDLIFGKDGDKSDSWSGLGAL